MRVEYFEKEDPHVPNSSFAAELQDFINEKKSRQGLRLWKMSEVRRGVPHKSGMLHDQIAGFYLFFKEDDEG